MALECRNIMLSWAAAAKSLQSCPTLCNPIDGSPPVSPVPGILQARTLEWVAISFSNAWKWKVKVKLLSRIWLIATPWTAAYQAPLSMGFSRQEHTRFDIMYFHYNLQNFIRVHFMSFYFFSCNAKDIADFERKLWAIS